VQAIIVGGVYLVADEKLTMSPEAARTVHDERRRFVVLSGPTSNSDPDWPVVLGCPISASTSFKTRFDVKLGFGEAGVTKKCWIRVPALQPLMKTDLQDRTGQLDAAKLEELQARVLEYMELISDESGEAADDGPPF
jgi:mRNA-degrading endonuclease toxin of MazEF toxin-antitoxin module